VIGPGIIVPVVVVAVVVPVVWWLLHSRLRGGAAGSAASEPVGASGRRITSDALRSLPSPPWRVVPEIADRALGGIEHVLIGPGGIFAVVTSLTPLPTDDPAAGAAAGGRAAAMAASAIARLPLDELLAGCRLTSTAHVTVHWGQHGDPGWRETAHAALAVAGDRLDAWAASLPERLDPADVTAAWRAVTTGIGRPDPSALAG
jgi:hypothetical protein